MNRERFLVKSYGDNINGTRIGLTQLLNLLKKYNNAVIVIPQLNTVNSTMLVDVLGDDISKKLIKNREITLQGNKKINLCSQLTLKNYKYADIYLALWGTEYMIQEIEELKQWKAAILVTWLPQDSIKWEEMHTVTTVYDDKKG